MSNPAGGSPVATAGSSSAAVIGRLPTHPTAAGSEDDELELLELQLLVTQPPNPAVSLSSWSALCAKSSASSTYPRKRRLQKSLMTLWHDRGLLDEVQTEQTRKMLCRITDWDYNAFAFDRLTNGQNLATMCTHLFEENGLLSYYRIDPLVVRKFFFLVEQGYHSSNPYHNGVHAADVTQAMNCFLQEDAIRYHLTPLEVMASLVAAACHDLDHPGKSEKFMIATNNPLACMYNNSSVLENHHWRSAVAALWESGLMSYLDEEAGERLRFQDLMREVILATDISRQGEFLCQLKQYLDGDQEMDLSDAGARQFVLQIAMKCADISNPCRSWNISRLWSHRACEEFFRQGDRERELGLAVTPICDRYSITVAKVQLGFYRGVAAPLFEEWHRLLGSPLTTSMMHNFVSNQARWDLIVQQEARNTMVESVASTSSSSNGGTTASSESRRESLDPPSSNLSGGGGGGGGGHYRHQRLSRSSGEGDDDSSDPCSSYPYLPLDQHCLEDQNKMALSPVVPQGAAFTRRHSLPLSETRSARLTLASRTSSEDSSDEQPHSSSSSVSPYPPTPSSSSTLHRQYSLVERRRYNVLRHQQSDPTVPNNFRLTSTTHKRRMFGKATSEDKVTFQFGAKDDLDDQEVLEPKKVFRMTVSPAPPGGGNVPGEDLLDEEEDDKENSVLLEPPANKNLRHGARRGSAPSSLFLGIRHSWTSLSTSNKSPTSPTSRELSPTLKRPANANNSSSTLIQRLSQFNNSRRRGSLPVEDSNHELRIFQQGGGVDQQQRSSSCGREQHHQQGGKKKRGFRVLRRQSGGSETLRSIASSSSSPQRLNDIAKTSSSNNNQQQQQGLRSRRGTLRRHHSHGQQHQPTVRRGSVPVGAMFIEDMLIDSLMLNDNDKGNNRLRSQQIDLLKAQVLKSLSPGGGGGGSRDNGNGGGSEQLIEDFKSSLALLNGRRGSLPTDFSVAKATPPSFVK